MKPRRNNLAESFNILLEKSQGKSISLATIFETLSGRGFAALLILFSFPFCFPITIPGLSTPFGLASAYIGLRLAFGKYSWLPQYIMEKKVSYRALTKAASIAIGTTNRLRFFLSSRLIWLVRNSKLRILHGLTIAVLSLLLAMPLPIPFSNTVSAIPLVLFGLALLEDDGLILILAYLFTFFCFAFFATLLWFGKSGVTFLLNSVFLH